MVKKSGTLYEMEGEILNQVQNRDKYSLNTSASANNFLSDITFTPSALIKKREVPGSSRFREKSALAGLILGSFAVISWVVILLGVFYSVTGIVFSIIGLKSEHQKLARIGLGLSILGFVLSLWYVFAAYQGAINYNYFTSEFWGR